MATMKDKKEKGYGLGRSQEAIVGRTKQLKQWEASETNREEDTIKTSRKKPRVKFSDGVIFLAATAAGDINEVEHLILEDGINVNYKNLDGMTALHQCCIDDNLDMATVLVKNNADIDAQDKEGWTPLHAASSCGHAHIVQYLLNSGAHPALVNSDGDTPFDIAEDDEVQELLQGAIDSQGIDVVNQKQREEQVLLNDAMKLKNNPDYKPVISPGGATLLHIACAKGYDKIIQVLLSCDNIVIDAIDDDGWTPLHAAVYWGHMEVAELLVEHGANMNAITGNGDAIDDIVDPELAEKLDDLKLLSESCQKDQKIITGHVRTPSYSGSADGLKHNSPSLKRRHSKDRAEYPKLLDMLREKKELQSMREQEQDEQTTSPPLEASVAKEQSPALTTAAATQPHKEHLVDSQSQHTTQHQEQTEDSNKVKQPLQVSQSIPPVVVNHIAQEEKKLEKRASVSERRKIFEPAFSGGSGIQDKKLAIRGREKTPGHTAPQDRDKNSNNPAQQSSTPLSHKQSDTNQPKRFSFVPKHVAPYDDARLPTDGDTKTVVPKRSSSDGRTNVNINTKNLTNKSPFFSSSANEIREPQHLSVTKTSTDFHERNKQRGSSPTDTKGTNESNKQRGNSPTDTKVTTSPVVKKTQQRAWSSPNFQSVVTIHHSSQQITNHDENLNETVPLTVTVNDTSVLSSASESVSSGFTTPDSSLLSERSNSIFSRLHSEEAETKRRKTAKKKREARRVTQPVDNDLLRMISKEDLEQEKCEDELQVEAEQLADKLKPKQSPDKDKETTSDVPAGDQSPQSGSEHPATSKPIQSRFKPGARPPPRVIGSTLSQPLFGQTTLWSRDGSKSPNPAEISPSASMPASVGSSGFSLPKPAARQDSAISEASTPGTPGDSRGRAHSDIRRRPKSSRRSTGITFEGENGEEEKQEVSEELCKIMVSANARKLPQTPDQAHCDDAASRLEPTADPPPPPPPGARNAETENAELRRLLEEERSKKDKIYDDFYNAAVKIDELKKNNAELTRRSEDTSRAYEQEKKEKERLQTRSKELEDMLKCFQDISSENQRLKDENGALIRVIGKLSRSPVQQH